MNLLAKIASCRKIIQEADSILIGAGAGMGVDSGLPDFRGKHGFWKAYPPLAKLGIEFQQMANPQWFDTNPRLAWGFYGHRFKLYNRIKPHSGFKILTEWINHLELDSFVFTSNVDGHFQKSGFESGKVYECHGSINHFQCFKSCGHPIWKVDSDLALKINSESLLAHEPFPECPQCDSIARPNILMFSDFGWDDSRTNKQIKRFQKWVDLQKNKNLLVLEIGAGTAIPTVRLTCEEIFQSTGNHFIRINPREPECHIKKTISLEMNAEKAIRMISPI